MDIPWPIIATLSVLALVLLASFAHHRRVSAFLYRPIEPGQKVASAAARHLNVRAEELAVVGVTAFDVLYNTAKLDPFALSGMNHLHHSQNFSSLGDLQEFMKSNIINSTEGSKAWSDMVHKYKGYTAEEHAIHGAHGNADIPISGTNPGHDMSINEDLYDVKTGSVGYIKSELADLDSDTKLRISDSFRPHFGADPRIEYDPSLPQDQILYDVTSDTFDGLDDLGDFIDGVPLLTLTISATKNTLAVKRGDKSIGRAVEHTATDTVAIGAAGWAGAKVGLGLGLLFAPVTGGASAIIIPAVTSTLGALIGAMSGKGIAQWWKERHLREYIKELSAVAKSFSTEFRKRAHIIAANVVKGLEDKKSKCAFARRNLQNAVMRVLFPTPLVKFYGIAIRTLATEQSSTKAFYDSLVLKLARLAHTEDGGGILLYAQGSSILGGDSQLLRLHGSVGQAVERVNKEKRAVS